LKTATLTLLGIHLGLALVLSSCGAKTGLRLPDASVEDAPDDVFVRFDACVAGRFTMVRREARMVFVIDRSGSMNQPLTATEPASRWNAMQLALAQTLPGFERDLQMGVLLYPRVPMSGLLASIQACDQLPGDRIDIEPSRENASAVVSAIRQFGPGGATPTAAAIYRATRYLRAREARGLAQYIVLATDGAPNCNTMLNPETCDCVLPSGCASAGLGARNCLDGDGAVASIDAARTQGIFTYVIGIDGDLEGRYVAVLDRMAVAGGRASSGSRRYFSIQDRTQLAASFADIQRTVVRCAYVTPSRPDDPDRITVRVANVDVPRDPTRREGWDWTDRDYGELTLYGAACQRVLGTALRIEATVACGR
jgi:hypothetical protein